MSISLKKKVLLQDLKNCKHWFSYCSKAILNDYTKEICAKQVANQSDFLKAFLHLEPLLIIIDLISEITQYDPSSVFEYFHCFQRKKLLCFSKRNIILYRFKGLTSYWYMHKICYSIC